MERQLTSDPGLYSFENDVPALNQRLLNRGRVVDPRVITIVDNIFIESKLWTLVYFSKLLFESYETLWVNFRVGSINMIIAILTLVFFG